MSVKTLTINGKPVGARADQTILGAARGRDFHSGPLPPGGHIGRRGMPPLLGRDTRRPPAGILCYAGRGGHEYPDGYPAITGIPADDRRAFARRAKSRLLDLRGQRQLRAPDAGLHAGCRPRPVRVPEPSLRSRRQPCTIRHRSQPLRALHALRACLRRDRGRPHLGRGRPRHRVSRHHRYAPSLGRFADLHLVRQVPRGLSDRGDFRPGLDRRRDDAPPRRHFVPGERREKKQWNV